MRVSNQSAQRPESLGQSHFYGSSSGSLLEKQARGKVIEQMTTALSKVAQEDSSGTSLPTVDAVAVKVEEELFKLYGKCPSSCKSQSTDLQNKYCTLDLWVISSVYKALRGCKFYISLPESCSLCNKSSFGAISLHTWCRPCWEGLQSKVSLPHIQSQRSKQPGSPTKGLT